MLRSPFVFVPDWLDRPCVSCIGEGWVNPLALPPSYYESLHLAGCMQASFYLIINCLMCACLSAFLALPLILRAVRDRFPQTRRLQKRASFGKRVGLVSSHVVWSWPRPPCCFVFGNVFWVRQDFVGFFFRFFFPWERTRPTTCISGSLASFSPLLVMRQGRGREAAEDVFCLVVKTPLSSGDIQASII